MENAKILIANTCEQLLLILKYQKWLLRVAMDTDKIKIFGARFKVDGTGKLAELERAEKVSLMQYKIAIYSQNPQ